MGIIYKITNKITNKIYVGQTTKSLEQRWYQHIKEANEALDGHRQSFPLFHRMIIKYKEENFVPEIIEECDNSKLNIREKYWISFFDSCNNGYNSTIGGQEIFKEKITHGSSVVQYTMDGVYIATFSSVQDAADTIKIHPSNIRKNCNGMTKSCGGFKWKWKSENEDIEYYEKKERKKNRKVCQYDLKGNLIKEYNNVKQAAEENSVNKSGIYNCCCGKQKISGGFMWSYKI